MGAFISYLHLAHGFKNFFVLAPNLTIYNKLIADFTPNTPKYVFKGIAEFATDAPAIITGDNYEALAGPLLENAFQCKVNIFNISKINSEVRGGKSPKIKRLSEYIGESYFDYLAGLDDLVLLMDESHRYRASAGSARDQRTEAGPRPGTDGHAICGDEQGRGGIQKRHLRLPAWQGDGGRLRQGTGRRHAQEFLHGRHVARGNRAVEAGRRRALAREREGGAGDLRARNGPAKSSSRSCWSSPATRRMRVNCWS